MKKVVLLFIIFVQIFALKPWLLCRDFIYHFSILDLNLQLIDAIHTDTGPLLLTRVFHNKPVFFILDIYRRYVHFIDPQLLIALLSLVGFFGLILGIWYFFDSKKKNKLIGFMLLLGFVYPLFEIFLDFKINFLIKIGIFWFPFMIISAWGNWRLIKSKSLTSAVFIYIVLILISIGLLINYSNSVSLYCYKP